MLIDLDWTEFKTEVIDKHFPINHKPTNSGYEVFSLDRTIVWRAVINDPTDVTDFEDNYKSNSNNRFNYIVDSFDEDRIFDDLAIRDITNHDSTNAFIGEFTAQTIFICNELDKDVTLQLQGSRDGARWVDIDNAFDVTAQVDSFETIVQFFPYYRMKAICSVQPTAGQLNIWLIKARV